jgi:hypothetical protein
MLFALIADLTILRPTITLLYLWRRKWRGAGAARRAPSE